MPRKLRVLRRTQHVMGWTLCPLPQMDPKALGLQSLIDLVCTIQLRRILVALPKTKDQVGRALHRD